MGRRFERLKGLSSLAEDFSEVFPESRVEWVHPLSVREVPESWMDGSLLSSLTESMKESGWQGRPVVMTPNRIAWTGTHRILAAREAKLDKIPVITVKVETVDFLYKKGLMLEKYELPSMLPDYESLADLISETGDSELAAIVREDVSHLPVIDYEIVMPT